MSDTSENTVLLTVAEEAQNPVIKPDSERVSDATETPLPPSDDEASVVSDHLLFPCIRRVFI
jgi:hypothetical protein